MVKKTNYAHATELTPGANIKINCEPEEPKPPDNFIDPNTYCYKGGKLSGIILGPRSINFPFNPERLYCFKNQRGEESMAVKSRKPDKEVLEALFAECNYVILRAAKLWSERSGIRTTDVVMRGWLIKDGIIPPASKPTVNPEFEAAFPEPPANGTHKQDKKRTPFDEPAGFINPYKSQHKPNDNDFINDHDDVPITFFPVEFDLAPLKLVLIRTTIQEGPANNLTEAQILEIIGKIQNMVLRA